MHICIQHVYLENEPTIIYHYECRDEAGRQQESRWNIRAELKRISEFQARGGP